jgi:hypothetical protein
VRAHRLLPVGVALLDPASAVFEAMLEGWATQQRARLLKVYTIEPRVRLLVGEFYEWIADKTSNHSRRRSGLAVWSNFRP